MGQFIGRLGVVSMPAVEAGLDLDQRVVRRHVAKLEAAGWLARTPWIWGEGSVVWLTPAGIECVGLGGVRAVRSPPAPTTITHAVLVGWSAARVEHRGRVWKSARELALEPDRWAVPTRSERGFTEQLPDLAVWLPRADAPIAVIAESGGRREDRQKMILEGWRDAIASGRYAGVLYDCASESVAGWINRLADKVQLTRPAFAASVQKTAAEIAALSPAAAENGSEDTPVRLGKEGSPHQNRHTPGETATIERAQAPPDQEPPPPTREPQVGPESGSSPSTGHAERERRYREIFGMDDHRPRRRWRR